MRLYAILRYKSPFALAVYWNVFSILVAYSLTFSFIPALRIIFWSFWLALARISLSFSFFYCRLSLSLSLSKSLSLSLSLSLLLLFGLDLFLEGRFYDLFYLLLLIEFRLLCSICWDYFVFSSSLSFSFDFCLFRALSLSFDYFDFRLSVYETMASLLFYSLIGY